MVLRLNLFLPHHQMSYDKRYPAELLEFPNLYHSLFLGLASLPSATEIVAGLLVPNERPHAEWRIVQPRAMCNTEGRLDQYRTRRMSQNREELRIRSFEVSPWTA